MDPLLDLQTVRIVRAIADAGSITAAAEQLGYSQPAVSQHLRRVERRVGVPLVLRQGRGVRLTEAGEVLARHAVSIGAALDAAAGELAELAGGRSGTVRMAAFPTASATVLPRIIAGMARAHPGITVTSVEAEPPEAVELIATGGADLAVTFGYDGDPPADVAGLASTWLFSEPMTLVLPAAHRLAQAATGPVALGLLRDERWIAGCPVCRNHLVRECARTGFAPAIDYETDNPAAVVNLVGAGLGVAVLPALALATTVVPPAVRVRPVAAPFAQRDVSVTFAGPSRRVPAVAAALGVIEGLDLREWSGGAGA